MTTSKWRRPPRPQSLPESVKPDLACRSSLGLGRHFFALAAAACGKAPSGELSAQRIAAAAPSLYQGPVWVKDALYFSDFNVQPPFASRIRKLALDGSVSTVIEDSGSNGLAVDAHGNLIAATHQYKALSRYVIASGKRSPVAERYQGEVFDSTNDIAIAADGTIYFTDPDYQKAAAGGQPVTGVYRVFTPAGQQLAVIRVDAHITNAAFGGRDGQTLYLTGAAALWQIDLDVTGSPY